ncbi:TPA: phage tail protein [Neisseria gonorrhoeae]
MQLYFNSTHIEVFPTDESYRYRSIMGEHTLTLYFSLSTYTDIPTGAWCEFANERYTLNQPAKIVKHNTRNFEYTLTMDSEGANLKNYKFRNPNDKTLKFPFTASPRYHIQILVDCLNMIDSGWQVGNCIEASEKLVSYSHNNCLEALEMIAKAFETEYEIIGKTIHLHKVEYFKDNPLPLQYGKGKGFKTGVSRTTEQSRITRLYVQGGERNIDRSKYGNKELLLPKSQEYVYEGVTFVSDNKGLSIAIKDAQNNGFINEQSLDLSHIYPKRKGRVSAVFEVDKAKHFYDFTDTSIPEALNFSELQIKGEKMLIYFESGMLSGREFEISRYEHSSGYNHSARRFEIVPKEEDGVTMPNDIFKPAIGDEYSVYNMQMPNAYICDDNTKTGASWEMMKEACKYLYENRADMFTFTGDLDGIWAKKNWTNVGGRLKMGGYINFSDTEIQRTPVAIRIVGLKEYVNNPYSPQIELSNKVQGQSFSSEMRKLQNQEVYFGELNKRTQSLTKRSWRDAQETIKQIEEAFPEYTKSIVPATVQTMMALIGNKSTQFDFVVSKTNPVKTPHTLYFDKNTKQINAGSGWLKHFTLGSSDITPNRDANSYKYWNIPAFVSGRLDDKAKTYYLYIKASKNDETAEFILSENKIDLEQEAGFYHFLYATVNSEYEGERGIAKHNGFTEITGGQIKTDKITSGNGEQYIHLLDNEIIIKANLKITDGNKTEIKQLVSPDLQLLESRLKQFSNENAAKGEIYLRGTGLNRHATPIIQINGQNVVPDNYRGLYLVVIRRSDLQVIFQQNYDTFINEYDAFNKLSDKLNDLSIDVLVTLVSRDSAFQNENHVSQKLKEALMRCGANDDNSKFVSRMPYAFLGIPSIGKGNGIEVYTSTEVNAPYAEIATKIINGTPQGMNSIFSGMLQTAKTATEAYARTQSELTKAQAIATADGKITEAEQRQIQQLQQKLQEAKTFAQQKVDELNIGGRNLILNSKPRISQTFSVYGGIKWYDLSQNLEVGETYVLKFKNHKTEPFFFLWNSRWGDVQEIYNGIPFTAKIAYKKLFVHTKQVPYECDFEMLKLERGNKATDWTPAPEDVWDTMVDLGIIDKNAMAINEAEKANVKYINGTFSKGADYTNGTEIVKNTITTGALTVGNTLGGNAGINGAGLAGNSIRFFAGKPYSQKEQAPFRVDDNGELWATNAHISGNIDAKTGQIGDLTLSGGLYSSNWDRKKNKVDGGVFFSGSGVLYRDDSKKVKASFGSIAGSIFGVNSAMFKIEKEAVKKSEYDKRYNIEYFTGQTILVPPYPNEEVDVSFKYLNDRAQFIYGDTFNFGASAKFDYVYSGLAYANIIELWLGVTNTFIFTDVPSDMNTVRLPSATIINEILNKLGVENVSRDNLGFSFEITIIVAHSVNHKRIKIQGTTSGFLVDNNGGWMNGVDNGYLEISRGDVVKLRYYNPNYYITSLHL